MGPQDLIFVGVAQALALAPGVSRSGAAYAAARSRGISKDSAASISIVTGLSLVGGASAFTAATQRATLARHRQAVQTGATAAAISSVAASFATRTALTRGCGLFAAYRWLLAAAVLRQPPRKEIE